MRFILAEDGATPIPADLPTLAAWRMEHPSTEAPVLIERTELGGVEVVTAFVGQAVDGEPVTLWATTVDGGLLGGGQWRYPTAAAAQSGHAVVVDAVRRCAGPPAGVPQRYWIWSNEHGAWWPQHRHGYVGHLHEAGRFTLAETKAIVEGANVVQGELPWWRRNEVAVPVLAADVLAERGER